MTLEKAKQYLKVDYDDDDELINSMLEAVDLFLMGAITNYEKIKELKLEKLDILILSCLQDFYDNRGFYQEKEYKPNKIIQSIIQQLDIEGASYVD